MPFLHKRCENKHYNTNKTVKIQPRNGYSSVLSKNIWLYSGDWVNDKRQGFGVLAKKTKCKTFDSKYKGDWYANKKHGSGNGYYIDGGYYVGKWKNSKRSGFGKMWYTDGSFYAGEWKCDKRNGLGLFVNVCGDRYEGNWENNEKNGFGRYFYLSTGQMQEGTWYNNIPVDTTMEDIPFRQTVVYPTEYPITNFQFTHPDIILPQKQTKSTPVDEFYLEKKSNSSNDNDATIQGSKLKMLREMYKYI